jgi:hypothetical protein
MPDGSNHPQQQEGKPVTPLKENDLIREAVGYFNSADALEAAIDDLMSSGFDRAQISLLAGEQAVEQKLGHKYTKVAELEDEPGIARRCYVSKEALGDAEGGLIGAPLYVCATATAGVILATGGTMAAAILGAALAGGAGGLFGGVLAKLLGDRYARHIEEQLEHGGLILWVRTWTADDENRAVAIFKKHSGQDIHIHSIPAAE